MRVASILVALLASTGPQLAAVLASDTGPRKVEPGALGSKDARAEGRRGHSFSAADNSTRSHLSSAGATALTGADTPAGRLTMPVEEFGFEEDDPEDQYDDPVLPRYNVADGAAVPDAAQSSTEQRDVPPALGKYGAGYEVTRFLARGGQAEVWKGRGPLGGPVVFRLPRALCAERWCRIGELDQETLAECHNACSLSRTAVARHRARFGKLQDGRPRTPFPRCRLPLSDDPNELAFEVWSFISGVTMTEAFFTNSPLGAFSMQDKRAVLAAVADTLVTLADTELDRGKACCCFEGGGGFTDGCKLVRGDCSWPYKARANACGPIVHHDIKFDNVMVGRSFLRWAPPGGSPANSGATSTMPITSSAVFDTAPRVRIALVDFGAAALCASQSAPAYSQDWVPFWITDGNAFSRTECWSYDTFGLGLAWLVTELLAKMPAAHLVCLAALGRGLVSHADMVNSTAGGVSVVHSCGGNVKTTWDLMQHAMEPVSELVREVSLKVLKASEYVTKDANALHGALLDFVAGRETLPRAAQKLPLTAPSLELLQRSIFPMIRECPDYPGTVYSHRRLNVLTRCRCKAAARRLRRVQSEVDPGMAMVNMKQIYSMSAVEYIPEMALEDMEPSVAESFQQVMRECPTRASAA